jgi:uncharacterized iron-regulated protein
MIALHRWVALAGFLAALAAGSARALPPPQAGGAEEEHPTRVVDLSHLARVQDIIPKLLKSRVICVGETHDRYDHHLGQLEVIRRLHGRGARLAIGMEYFQQPFQSALDEYVAGRIDERELLARTEYYDRWRFDYRLYRPILAFAREHGIPLVALNLPAEVTSKAGRVGIEGLTVEERASLPEEIDRSDTAYHERLRAIYTQHPSADGGTFERWLDVQLLWDEGMAARAARYLAENPEHTLVVLAGSGHLAYRSGIPNRIARRSGVPVKVLLPTEGGTFDPAAGDYLLASAVQALPPGGRLGALLDSPPSGGVVVKSLEPGSAARDAGVREGDRLVSVGGIRIGRFADVRIALLDRQPGDTVEVRVSRDRWLGADEEQDLAVTLR